MKVANIYESKEWFEVLQTSQKSQTAVMTLDAGGNSSEEENTHEGSDQVLLLVEGELRAEVDGEERLLHSGDVCVVPAGTKHRFENVGQFRAVTFNVYAPPEYPAGTKG